MITVELKLSTAGRIPFFMADQTDGLTGITGLTPTVTLSKNGGSFGAAGGSPVEVGGGWYYLDANTTDANTAGFILLKATGTGCIDGQSYAQVNTNIASDLATLITAVDDLVDTEIAAIKTVVDAIKVSTDALPSDPADQSILAGLITAVDDLVDTELAAVKTVVDAIKVSTDALPSDPADASDVAALVTAVDDLVDTEVAAIKTVVDAIKLSTDNLPSDPADASVLAGLIDTVDNFVDTEVAAIKAKTDLIPAAPAAVGDIPTVAQIWASVIETGFTATQSMRLMLAALAGKLSGAATGTVTIRDVNDTKDRLVASVDADGNRSAVTKDVT